MDIGVEVSGFGRSLLKPDDQMQLSEAVRFFLQKFTIMNILNYNFYSFFYSKGA